MVFGVEVLILKSKCLKTEPNKRIEISSGRKIGEIDDVDVVMMMKVVMCVLTRQCGHDGGGSGGGRSVSGSSKEAISPLMVWQHGIGIVTQRFVLVFAKLGAGGGCGGTGSHFAIGTQMSFLPRRLSGNGIAVD